MQEVIVSIADLILDVGFIPTVNFKRCIFLGVLDRRTGVSGGIKDRFVSGVDTLFIGRRVAVAFDICWIGEAEDSMTLGGRVWSNWRLIGFLFE